MKALLLAITTLAFCGSLFAQAAALKEERPQVFLHFDKGSYLPGETVFFKAYIVQDGLLSTAATSLYMDVKEGSGQSKQHVFPIYGGTASGSIDISASTAGSSFRIAACTDLDAVGDSVTAVQTISIVQPETKPLPATAGKDMELRVFPEGGVLTEGVRNIIAFEGLVNGAPAVFDAVLQDGNGDTVAKAASIYQGMGKLEFTPEAGATYRLAWRNASGQTGAVPLPVAVSESVSLHTEQLNGRLYYIISTQSSAARFDKPVIALYARGEKIYHTAIDFKGKFISNGAIGIAQLPPGIVTVKLWGGDSSLLAERLVFVNQPAVWKPVSVKITGTLAKKSRGDVEITVPDTAFTNMSLSIFDDRFSDAGSTTIAAHYLLNSGLRGRIRQPSYYFSDTVAAVQQRLDLLLLTHGWRRTEMQRYTDSSSYITVSGTVRPRKSGAKMPAQVVLIIKEKENPRTNTMIPVPVAPDGRFVATGLVFSDSALVYCSIGKTAAESENYEVKLEGGLPVNNMKTVEPAIENTYPYLSTDTAKVAAQRAFLSAQKIREAGMLDEVVIRTRKPSRTDELEQRYTTGFFKGGADIISVDVASDSLAWAKGDIYNYLQGKLPNATLKYTPAGKAITFLRYGDPLIYVDESLIDNDQLTSIPIERVAYIKFIRQYFGARNDAGGFSPAISIYLKKDEDLLATPAKGAGFTRTYLRGYTVSKEFYAADPASFATEKTEDARTTLFWQPYVLTGGKEHKAAFSFYNNDRSTRLRLVLQGVDENGRWVYVEKIIE